MKRPVIGVPICYDYSILEKKPILYIFESVRRTIQKAGGEVNLLVPVQDVDYIKTRGDQFPELTLEEEKRIQANLDKCDGLFLPGGIKFVPYNRYILDYAVKKDIPVLGVCLSMQMMTCFEEEVHMEDNTSEINHNQGNADGFCHTVTIDKNSKLYEIIGEEEIEVNSIHNHHGTENHIYKTVAVAPDGIVEAIEHPTCTFNIGVQWHPEKSYRYDRSSKLLIDQFIEESRKYAKCKMEKEEVL